MPISHCDTWCSPSWALSSEYLSPERSKGEVHDERLSDMWALGVTFFEIATGRTPFEHEDEQFLSKEQLEVYYKRTLSPKWVGTWSIPRTLESLCRLMLRPDPKDRILSEEALMHPFFCKSGSYYESTVSKSSDSGRYKDHAARHNDEQFIDHEEPMEEARIPDVRDNKSTRTKPQPLQALAKEKHVEQESPFTSPRANPKDVRQSLKVPVCSPLSSYQSGEEIELSNDEVIEERRAQDNINHGMGENSHLQGEQFEGNGDARRLVRQGIDLSTNPKLMPIMQGSSALHRVETTMEQRGGSSTGNQSSNVEETLSSSGEATRSSPWRVSEKQKRPRPQTFHGAMFQAKEVRQLKSSEQGGVSVISKQNNILRATNDDAIKRGECCEGVQHRDAPSLRSLQQYVRSCPSDLLLLTTSRAVGLTESFWTGTWKR